MITDMAPAHKTFTALLCPSSRALLLLIVSVIFFQIFHFTIFRSLYRISSRIASGGSPNFIVLRGGKKGKGRLKLSLRFQTTSCRISNLVPSPVRRGRLGWGWLRGFRQNQIRAAHRATLSPTLSRQTGEGTGCTSWHRFLSTRQFQTTSCHISNLIPSPVWRGKVRMGVASRLEAKSNSRSP